MPPKVKGTKMNMSELCAFVKSSEVSIGSPSSSSWADETFELPSAPMGEAPRMASTTPSKYVDDSPRGRLHQKMQQEATLARASTAAPVDISRLPNSPPFTLFMGNLSFDASESDIRSFFGSGVKNVKLIMDQATGRPKGFGYVEFVSVEDLKRAVQLNGQSLKGRAVRLDISEGKSTNLAPSSAGEWRKGDIVGAKVSHPTQSTAPSDWRASARPQQSIPDTLKPSPKDWRARSSHQQQPPSANTPKFDNRQRSPRKQSFAVPLDIHKRETKEQQETIPSERPILKLQPRSKPVEETRDKKGLANEYLTSSKPNPFGAANPKTIDDPTLKQAPVDKATQ